MIVCSGLSRCRQAWELHATSNTPLPTTTTLSMSTSASNNYNYHCTASTNSVSQHGFWGIPCQHGLSSLSDPYHHMHNLSRWDIDVACKWGTLSVGVSHYSNIVNFQLLVHWDNKLMCFVEEMENMRKACIHWKVDWWNDGCSTAIISSSPISTWKSENLFSSSITHCQATMVFECSPSISHWFITQVSHRKCSLLVFY